MELVGERDAELVGLLVGDRVDVGALALVPGRLGFGVAVGVGVDDPCGVLAELEADAFEHRRAAAVLDGVVQERADRLGLAAAHLEHERGHAEEVRDVGDRGALAQLAPVVIGREEQRAIEGVTKQWLVGVGLGHRTYDPDMGERTSYAPGTVSWAELMTSDAESAKAFYTSVFGWEYRDNPVGDDQVYSTALRDGKDVGALYASEQPPQWNCYVTVESADASAARAAELGATVAAEAFDIFDVGRMAIIVDPVGAALCLWEPKRHIGATLVNAPGALTWADLITPDPADSARFYGELFGWTTEEVPDAGGYRVIKNGEGETGGMMPLDPRMGAIAAEVAAVLRPRGHRIGWWRRSPASAGRCSTGRCRCGRARSRCSPIRRARPSRSGRGHYDD